MTDRDDLPEIKAALTERLEALAESQLGAPLLRKGRAWRWGSKGAVAVIMLGAKRGSWFDYESQEGGGPLDLIMRGQSCKLPAAIEWARHWLGMTAEELAAQPRAPRVIEMEERDRAERAAGIGRARMLAAESVSIYHTPAERYLTKTRGIPFPPARWPDALRFHPILRALLLVATDAAGACQAVQTVRLTPEGAKATDGLVKRSTGPGEGAAVRLPPCGPDRDPIGPLVLAEGPETGITAWACSGYETWIMLGSMAKAVPVPGRVMVLCRDDDPLEIQDRRTGEWKPHPARELIDRTLMAWRAAGHRAVDVFPWRVPRHDKSDLNDVVREAGAGAVRSRIDRALGKLMEADHAS